MSSMANRAHDERKRRGETQEEVALRADISLRTYQMFESGKTSPQGQTLRKIMDALDLTDDEVEVAEATRDEWPRDVKVFLDMMGAWLMARPEESREGLMQSVTRYTFGLNG